MGKLPEPFFARAEVLRSIEQLGSSQDLAIIAGAGVGVQARLPKWRDLVERLLTSAIARNASLADDAHELAASIIDHEGLIASATLASTVLGSTGGASAPGLAEAIHEVLYVGHDGSLVIPRPGSIAVAIARAQARWGAVHLKIATTNYDLLIEQALTELIDREKRRVATAKSRVVEEAPKYPRLAEMKRVVPIVKRDTPTAPTTVPVWHLHGVVGPNRKPTKKPILTESDYHQSSSERGWQQRLVEHWLGERAVLFIGASLTDPDLLRTLFSSAADRRAGRPIVALLPRTRRHVEPDQPMACDEREAEHERLSVERWRSVGVTALYFDYHFQSAQFLTEATRVQARFQDRAGRRGVLSTSALSATSYCDRLGSWYEGYCRERLGFEPSEPYSLRQQSFAATQPQLTEVLSQAVGAIHSELDKWGRPDVAEDLSLHVWSRYPPERALAMTGASDRSWTSLSAVNRKALWHRSRFLAVSAFTEGRWMRRSDGEDVGHLGYQLAVPIELGAGEWHHLPVGVITLSSTASQDRSVMGDLSEDHFDDLIRYLQRIGQRFLDPTQQLAGNAVAAEHSTVRR